MGYLDNRSILAKADLALADLTAGGGVLQPAQAKKSMRLLIKHQRAHADGHGGPDGLAASNGKRS